MLKYSNHPINGFRSFPSNIIFFSRNIESGFHRLHINRTGSLHCNEIHKGGDELPAKKSKLRKRVREKCDGGTCMISRMRYSRSGARARATSGDKLVMPMLCAMTSIVSFGTKLIFDFNRTSIALSPIDEGGFRLTENGDGKNKTKQFAEAEEGFELR